MILIGLILFSSKIKKYAYLFRFTLKENAFYAINPFSNCQSISRLNNANKERNKILMTYKFFAVISINKIFLCVIIIYIYIYI